MRNIHLVRFYLPSGTVTLDTRANEEQLNSVRSNIAWIKVVDQPDFVVAYHVAEWRRGVDALEFILLKKEDEP